MKSVLSPCSFPGSKTTRCKQSPTTPPQIGGRNLYGSNQSISMLIFKTICSLIYLKAKRFELDLIAKDSNSIFWQVNQALGSFNTLKFLIFKS